MNINEQIRQTLWSMQDEGYKAFQCKLMPTVSPDTVIGVRTPQLRDYAKALHKQGGLDAFFSCLPHGYYEENNLHAFLIEKIKDYDSCIQEVNRFLPYVDNWATCDTMRPKCFAKNPEALLSEVEKWLASGQVYTVRYGIGMLMAHFLDERFQEKYLRMVAEVQSEEYYINMMIAWYFATALAKQYESAVKYIEENRLPVWVHNKTIQKAVESYRITQEQKAYLRSFKRR